MEWPAESRFGCTSCRHANGLRRAVSIDVGGAAHGQRQQRGRKGPATHSTSGAQPWPFVMRNLGAGQTWRTLSLSFAGGRARAVDTCRQGQPGTCVGSTDCFVPCLVRMRNAGWERCCFGGSNAALLLNRFNTRKKAHPQEFCLRVGLGSCFHHSEFTSSRCKLFGHGANSVLWGGVVLRQAGQRLGEQLGAQQARSSPLLRRRCRPAQAAVAAFPKARFALHRLLEPEIFYNEGRHRRGGSCGVSREVAWSEISKLAGNS